MKIYHGAKTLFICPRYRIAPFVAALIILWPKRLVLFEFKRPVLLSHGFWFLVN